MDKELVCDIMTMSEVNRDRRENDEDCSDHFITKDKKSGGHLLECQMENVKIEIDYTSKFYMVLPERGEFHKVDLTKEKQTELEKVKKGGVK